MAKTAEQRAKDLDAGVTWVLDTAWGDVASKFKEVNTPIFKKNGDIGALAKRYDGVKPLPACITTSRLPI